VITLRSFYMLPMALCWAPNRLFYNVHRFKDPLKNWLGFKFRGPCYSVSCTVSVKQSRLHRLCIILVGDVFYQALVSGHIYFFSVLFLRPYLMLMIGHLCLASALPNSAPIFSPFAYLCRKIQIN